MTAKRPFGGRKLVPTRATIRRVEGKTPSVHIEIDFGPVWHAETEVEAEIGGARVVVGDEKGAFASS